VKIPAASLARPLLIPPLPESLPRPPEESKWEDTFSKGLGPQHPSDLKCRTHGEDRNCEDDLRVESKAVDQDTEELEELFGQLWAVPKPDRVRVPAACGDRGSLFWVRKELLRVKRIHLEDCYPVSRGQRIEGIPRKLSFSRDILAQGKAMYVDILKRSVMAKGGGWVWQADMHSIQRGSLAPQKDMGVGL
jgi:hypothetical protein